MELIKCTVTVICNINFLSEEPDADMIERLRGAESVGRPIGDRRFLDIIERKTRLVFKPAKC